MELFAEILKEVLHEFTTRQFLIELVQGSVLIAVLVMAVPRLLRPRLAARRERIVSELEAATTAGEACSRAEREAAGIVSRARTEARHSIRTAKAEAVAERDGAVAAAEEESAEIVARARQTIEAEKAALASQACEQMVGLVTVIARRFLEEALTETERRALVEKVVVSSLQRMDSLSVE